MINVEIQKKVRSRVIQTEDGQGLSIRFKLGPLRFLIIANLPESDDKLIETQSMNHANQPLAYIRISFECDTSSDWSTR